MALPRAPLSPQGSVSGPRLPAEKSAAAKASAAAMLAAAEAAEAAEVAERTLLLRFEVWGEPRQSRGAPDTGNLSSKVLSAASAAANIAAAQAFAAAAADFSDGNLGPDTNLECRFSADCSEKMSGVGGSDHDWPDFCFGIAPAGKAPASQFGSMA